MRTKCSRSWMAMTLGYDEHHKGEKANVAEKVSRVTFALVIRRRIRNDAATTSTDAKPHQNEKMPPSGAGTWRHSF